MTGHRNPKWVQITGVLRRDGFDSRSFLERIKDYALWRWHSAVRAAKNPAKWWRHRKRVRQINRYLLAEARKYETHR